MLRKHENNKPGLDTEASMQERQGNINSWRHDLETDITQTVLGWQQLEDCAGEEKSCGWPMI